MPYTDRLFDEALERAAEERGVPFEHRHADAVGTGLVTDPGRYA